MLTIVPPTDTPLRDVGSASTPDISPDGSAVLYNATNGLFVRRLDSLTPTLVSANGGDSFWSADSTSVFFSSQGALVRIRLPDGAPEVVAQLPGFTRSGSANADGAILISSLQHLYLLEAPGGEFKKLEVPDSWVETYPEFLPNGKDFLYSQRNSGIHLASIEDGKIVNSVKLMDNDNQASYTPAGGGRIVFVRNNNLYSQTLDLSQRKLVGESQLILEGVGSIASHSANRADFSVSRSGTVVWRPGRAASSQVTTFDRTGKVIGTTGPPLVAFTLSLSPDGTRLLAAGGSSTLLLNVGQPGSQGLGPTEFNAWLPDGAGIVGFGRTETILTRPLAGGDIVELGPFSQVKDGSLLDLSPDGTQMLYSGLGALRVKQLAGSPREREPRVLVETGVSDARFSPDGHWIVFNQNGLFVQPFPGPGLRRQIAPGGTNPLWRGDGREILFLGSGGVSSIPVQWTGGEPQFGAPTLLFQASGVLRRPVGSYTGSIPWAVPRDGSRIYWLQGADQPGSNMIDVRTNAV